LRTGSTTETNSGFDKTKADEIKTLAGIKRTANGEPMAAGEIVTIPVVERRDGSRANVIVRGIEPVSRQLRPNFQVLPGGKDLEPGKGECLVSQNLSRRFKGASVGEIFRVSDSESYRVVGLFTAGGSAAESEIWVDVDDLRSNSKRFNVVSSVQFRAASSTDQKNLMSTIKGEQRFALQPLTETQYFLAQTESSLFLKGAGIVIALFLSFGAMFAAANTMFSAVKSRAREIGTMRALGFPGHSILISFLLESLILCSLGGLIGVLATLPLSSLTFGTSNFSTFSEITVNFRFGVWVITAAIAMTLAMGVFGGLFPAIRAVRLNVIDALREL
jgi:putative ABC transport system permease protein